MDANQWEKLREDPSAYAIIKESTDPLRDTTLRQFRNGNVLRYGVDIFNAKLGSTRSPDLTTQVKLYRNGKLFFEGTPGPVSLEATVATSVSSGGGIRLDSNIPPGEYILQVLVTDNLAKGKRKTVSQFAQFEVVE